MKDRVYETVADVQNMMRTRVEVPGWVGWQIPKPVEGPFFVDELPNRIRAAWACLTGRYFAVRWY